MSQQLVLATRNQGKVKEISELLGKHGFEVRSLADYPDIPEIEETGKTFYENALIKAKTVAEHVGALVLADDSGLEVGALDGKPGVRSARFAGPNATDAENNAKLAKELSDIFKQPFHLLGEGHPPIWSKADFVCSLVLVDPVQNYNIRFEGRCGGYIIEEPRGSNGFGYDPYFYMPEHSKTMAELSLEEKNTVSHRAKALRQLIDLIEKPVQS